MLTYSSSTQIFKNENLPQFITTMGEKKMSITAKGTGKAMLGRDKFKTSTRKGS